MLRLRPRLPGCPPWAPFGNTAECSKPAGAGASMPSMLMRPRCELGLRAARRRRCHARCTGEAAADMGGTAVDVT